MGLSGSEHLGCCNSSMALGWILAGSDVVIARWRLHWSKNSHVTKSLQRFPQACPEPEGIASTQNSDRLRGDGLGSEPIGSAFTRDQTTDVGQGSWMHANSWFSFLMLAGTKMLRNDCIRRFPVSV
jgi:hypothetical protein